MAQTPSSLNPQDSQKTTQTASSTNTEVILMSAEEPEHEDTDPGHTPTFDSIPPPNKA